MERNEGHANSKTIVVLGPTASGKTAISIELASRLSGEIISADSRCFFEKLNIVTDKPTPDQQTRVKHHLIDIAPLTGSYDAMAFFTDVERLIPQIQAGGHVPMIVGGGTLYLGSILRGIFTGPSADPHIRIELSSQPLHDLYARLERIDPPSAKRIHPNDKLRIMRALEVYMITVSYTHLRAHET